MDRDLLTSYLHGCAKARPEAPRRRPRALHAEAHNTLAVAWHSRGGAGWARAALRKAFLPELLGSCKCLKCSADGNKISPTGEGWLKCQQSVSTCSGYRDGPDG